MDSWVDMHISSLLFDSAGFIRIEPVILLWVIAGVAWAIYIWKH